ncbi:MAG: PAS domain S-box protein, partial [Bdellovibrionales bacterium]|nr:PAS domain S-box protein [Bdellovibrionales bacterium]
MNVAPKYPVDSFEKLISTISTEFINLPLREIDSGIQRALELIGSYAGVDRSYILRTSPDGSTLSMIHEWRANGVPSAKSFYLEYPTSHFLELSEQSSQNGIIAISRLSEIPSTAKGLKATLHQRGVSSFVAVPLRWHNHLLGFVGFATLNREMDWREEDIALLELAAQIFVNALQRKRTEQALRESDIRYRTLVESLGEGLLFCDPEDHVIHINRRFSEITGFTHDEMYGKSVFDFFVPTSESENFRLRTERRLQGISELYTIELIRKGGEHFWAEISATPIHNEDGEIIGTLGAVNDITDRKNTLEALRASEEKYRTLLETSHDIIWSMDTKGCWTYINRAVEDILGFHSEDFLGQPFTAAQSQHHAQKDLEVFERILQGEKITHYETEFLNNEGTPVVLTVNAGPTYDKAGTIIGISGTASDITEQYRAAEALRKQEEFLREVIDANPNLIFAKDKSGRFTLVNQALAEVYGKPVEEIIGRTVDDFYTPEEARLFSLQDQEALRQTGESVITEQRIRTPSSNSVRWYQIIKKPLLSADGLPEQVLGVGIDLSNRKRSEEALKAIVEGTASSTAEDFFRSLVRHLALALNTKYAFLGIYADKEKTHIRTLANWRQSQYTEDVTYEIKNTASEKVLQEGFYQIDRNAQEAFP